MEIAVHVPELEAVQGVSVRPDVLLVAMSARIEDISPLQAVSMLKLIAAKLQSKALEVHPRADLSARKLDLGRSHADKASKAAIADAQMDGLLSVPLDDSLDYWARAELLAKVTELLRSFSVDMYRAKPSIGFGFRAPTPRVRDVTKHKAELTARYAAQWRALTGNAEKMPGMGSWDIPDEVAQYAVSLDEVRLTLVPTRR